MANIVINNLTKLYNNEKIVKDIHIGINDGEFVALVGPSGCGKTTTLKLIAGLIFPDQGQILMNGQDITYITAEKRDIVMVFQDHLLFPHLTVGENITFGLKMLGHSKKFRGKKLQELLNLVQLSSLENRYPSQLSGGQRQRVALARALALEPKVLLLDEPLSNLDPRLRDDMRELISELHKKLGMTTIFVTHDQDEAMLLANRIAVMFDGELAQYDTPYNLYNRPVSREVANLFGMCNFLTGILENGIFTYNGYKFKVPHVAKEGAVQAYVRAEHIEILDPDESIFTGVIKEKKYTGGQSFFKIRTEDIDLMAKVKNHLVLPEGAKVGIKIDWPRVWFQHRG